MSSLKSHRFLIASLFLPTTAVLGESGPPTPDHRRNTLPTISIPAVTSKLLSEKPKAVARATINGHGRANSAGSNILGPLRSIVEDLQDKTRHATPAVLSPAQESSNPFSKLNRPSPNPGHAETLFANEVAKSLDHNPTITLSPPPLTRKRQTTHTDHQHATRVSRKHSRSASRRTPSTHGDAEALRNAAFNSASWHFEPNPHCNGGLKNAVDSVRDRMKRKVWVGTLGTNTDSFNEPLKRGIDNRMLLQQSSIPVWIPDAEFESCYDEFCHQVLWPCLHYAVPDAPRTKLFYESESYKQYVAVNRRFADTIIANYQEGDVIWINDYHLMLVPQMLRASTTIPSHAPIGFFMHVAFPSSEIFRCISVREDLLRGMLGADFVAFQTPSFARHFRQTVSRILAYEALPKGIQIADEEVAKDDSAVSDEVGDNAIPRPSLVHRTSSFSGNAKAKGPNLHGLGLGAAGRGRFVDVSAIPMGIDVSLLKQRMLDPEVGEWVQVLRQRYAGMKLLVGRDKLDEIQGVRQKIVAFERFLERWPEFQGKVVLIQVALHTTESSELTRPGGVADVVSHINSRYSTLTYQPVVFLHTQDLTFSQYLALLKVADAFVVTSLREGMALRTHEFVECQAGACRPLILSEFTGSYSYSGFRSCISVNPWDTRGTSNAIYQALTMSDEEAASRWGDLHNHVITQTAQTFVTTFISRTIRANVEHNISSDLSDVPTLDMGFVLPRYKHSNRRLILLDFEGTLWKRDLSKPLPKDDTELPWETLGLLKRLTEEGDGLKNEVWLLSGLPREGVLESIRAAVPRMGIVAENGCFIKTRATRASPLGEWVSLVSNLNLTWKAPVVEILNYFTERTPGSFVEERGASVVWRFWTGPKVDSPDRQWARRQAAEAQNHIYDSLGERFGIRLIPGTNHFLVLPNNISRSTAVAAILHPGGPAVSGGGDGSVGGVGALGSGIASRRGSTESNPQSAGGYHMPTSFAMTPAPSAASYYSSLSDTAAGGGGGLAGWGTEQLDFILAVSADEKLIRRINDSFDETAETCSSSGKGTAAKWRLDLSGAGGAVEGAPGDVGHSSGQGRGQDQDQEVLKAKSVLKQLVDVVDGFRK